MSNPFYRHGIDHLSASSLNLWAAEPALWIMERLLGRRSPSGIPAARGKAVEAGVNIGLHNHALPVEACIAEAESAFDRETALNPDPRREEERKKLAGYVKGALAKLRQYGLPDADGYQDKVEISLDDIPVPVIGFVDWRFSAHGPIVDLKTTERLPTAISASHSRTGWLRFLDGQAPERRIDPALDKVADRPDATFKRGFVIMAYSPKFFGGIVELSSASTHAANPIRDVYAVFEEQVGRTGNRGKVPVIACTGSDPMKSNYGTKSATAARTAGRSSAENARAAGAMADAPGLLGRAIVGDEPDGYVSGGTGELADTGDIQLSQPQRRAQRRDGARSTGALSGELVNAARERRSEGRAEPGLRGGRSTAAGASGADGDPWGNAVWVECADGKLRRPQPGLGLLAHGISERVARLRTLGNAIVPQVAAQILGAIIASEARP